MDDSRRLEFAEAIPFSRGEIAMLLAVRLSTLNNWIDRNKLWQTPRRGYYRLKDVFDLAGFSAMRLGYIPQEECARFVYNYGFYRTFLSPEQYVDFSYRDGRWDIGLYVSSAVITLRINMRTLGEQIFARASTLLASRQDDDRGKENYHNFLLLYNRCIEEGLLAPRASAGSVGDAA